MSTTNHTPGPWKMETVRTSSGICHKIGPFPYRPNRQNHACVYVDYPSEGGPIERELEANARLITAAPEMATALETIALIAEGSTTANSLPNIAKIARDAIPKAIS